MAKQVAARQLVLAGGLALAAVFAPSVAELAGAMTPGAYSTVADPAATCGVSQAPGSPSPVCPPGVPAGSIGSGAPSEGAVTGMVPGSGAPSEGDLTAINAQRGR
jgi:hypothetical protein